MATTTVRASEHSHKVLRTLADERGLSITQALDEVVSDWERRRFFQDFNNAFARLKADPQAWAEELEERQRWDQTLLDDLEDEEAPDGDR